MIDAPDTMAPRLRSLLQNTAELSQELLLETNLDGAILEINPAWTSVLGWNESELRIKTFWDLIHPGDLKQTREEVIRAAEGETTSAFDIRCRHQDGSYRWISWRVVANGSILHGAGHDSTAEKDAIAALRECHESSRQIRKTESVSATPSDAHEFNNLMQSIVAALELVRKLNASGRSGETERFIVSAINSAQRAAALNQQLQGSPSDMPSSPDDR